MRLSVYIRPIFFILVAFAPLFSLNAQVQAQFTADTTSNCDPLLVTFTDQSTGNITSRTWNFGNGGPTVSTKNPSITFSQKKSYTVSLTVSDGINNDTETKQDYISIYNKPNANFSFSPKTGCEPLTVSFQDNSNLGDAPIRSYKWDFGDGSLPGTAQNPDHIYQNKGNFPPSLQITDTNNCISTIKKDSIQVLEAPVASFTSYNQPDTCGFPYTVNFKNTSQGVGITYKWTFGDGGTSTLTEPIHTYNAIDNYDVTLIAIGSNCNDTLEIKEFVKLASPKAEFELSVDTICINDTLTFTNNSTKANAYQWNFGDGTRSTSKSPKKVYRTAGLMEIILTAATAGTDCLNSTSRFVFVSEVIADFSIIDTFSCFQSKVVGLTDQSNNADSLAWVFNVEKIPDTVNVTYSLKGDTSLLVKRDDPIYSELSGNYIFTQIAKNKFGCADTLTIIDSIILYNIGAGIDVINNDSIVLWDSIVCGFHYGSFYGGCLPFEIDYNGTYFGPGNPVSWSWKFGNGDSSKVQDPTPVSYFDTLLHLVTLEVVDDSGCVLIDDLGVFGGIKPTADFNIPIVIDTVCYGDTVFIDDLSTGKFGINASEFIMTGNSDHGNFLDTNWNPFLTEYTDTGMFAIQHVVNDNGCSDTLIKAEQIYVLGPIISGLEFYADNCNNLREVSFGARVIDATGFEWNFGDSTYNTTELEPVHTYQRYGIFYASFKAWNDSTGCDTLIQDSIIVRVFEISPLAIVPVEKNLCFDLKDTVFIREPNAGIYSRYFWRINGDTIKTKSKSFRYVFKERGLHIVELETTDFLGCDYYHRDTFYISRPEAKIGTRLLEPCYPVEVEFFDNSVRDTVIDKWYWEFGYQDTSILEVDTRAYANPGRKNAYLRVENIYGCADSVFALDFLKSKVFDVGFLEGVVDICEGDTVTFRNVSSGTNPTYSWNFGDGTILNSNNTIIKHIYKNGGIYDVTLSGIDEDGCNLKVGKPGLVVVDSAVIAGFTADTTEANCYPLPVFFEDTSAGNIDSWKWTFGDGASSTLQNPFHNYTEVGEFDVFLKVTSKNGCSDSILFSDFIKTEGPAATFSMDKNEVCVNELVTFTVISTTNVDQFTWSFGDGFTATGSPATHAYSTPKEYHPSLILTNSAGNCVIEISDTITILNVFADFTVSDDTACVPLEIDFTNQSVGENAIKWEFGEGSTSNKEDPSIVYNNPGSYLVSLAISSDINCRDTAYKRIEVYPYPDLILTADTGICLGEEIVLNASGGLFYRWEPNRFLNTNVGNTVISKPTSTITYTVYTENIAACETIDSVEVFVPQKPQNNSLEDTTIYLGETVAIDVKAGARYTYQWSPPQGLGCTTCANPIAKPLRNTTYEVIIRDAYGCYEIRDTIEIKVTEAYSIDVPTAFSPNGDGINDFLFPKGWGLKGLIRFKIFNRYGELVFESTDFNQGWDGTYRGKPQDMDTYIYVVEALTYGDRILSKKGNISLLR